MECELKVVITDHRFPNVESERNILAEVGAKLIEGHAKTEEELIELTKDAYGIINSFAKITAKVINTLDKCKVIVRYGIGVDTIDIDAATEKGIMVCNVPDYCIEEVSDHALTLALCLSRKVIFSARRVLAGEWSIANLRPIKRLKGQTMGIVGYGRIGRRLAKKAKHLGFEIIAYDPFLKKEMMESEGVRAGTLEELLREADIVSLHAPLTANTKGIIGKDQLKIMKPTAYLVNVSRGPLVDEFALIEALKEGYIAGAGLDVLENEPPKTDNPLLKMENVIITPHAAWYSNDSNIELQKKAAQNIAQVISGQVPKTVLNPNVIKQRKR